MSDLLQKLESIKIRFEEVGQQIVDPDIIADMDRYVKLNKEYKDLSIIVQVYDNYKNTIDNIIAAREVMSSNEDADFKEMAKMEFDELSPQVDIMEEEIKVLLIPKDPNDDKNVIIELRAGAGGDEACIFVEDIFRIVAFSVKSKFSKSLILPSRFTIENSAVFCVLTGADATCMTTSNASS